MDDEKIDISAVGRLSSPAHLVSRASGAFLPMSFSRFAVVAKTLALGFIGAQLCLWLGTPVPWMMGSLFVVGGVSLAGQATLLPTPLRCGAQWIIGIAIGLYFTPAMLVQLGVLAPWLALNVVFSLVLGVAAAWFLQRRTGVDGATAFFSTAMGGASEMVVLAEKQHGLIDRVVAAHSVRMVLVVMILPLAMGLIGVEGVDSMLLSTQPIRYAALAVMIVATFLAMMLFLRLRAPNAWLFGPLVLTAIVTGAGIETSGLPIWLINGAQLIFGCNLASRFTPSFIRSAPRYLFNAALMAMSMLGLSVLFAWGIGVASGYSVATLVLATAPGGLGELSITAKALHLGVPVVAAFQVTRMIAVLLIAQRMHRWCGPWLDRLAQARKT